MRTTPVAAQKEIEAEDASPPLARVRPKVSFVSMRAFDACSMRHFSARLVYALPKAEALDLILRGLVAPEGWVPTSDELQEAAHAVLLDVETERARVGYSIEAWLKVPVYGKLYAAINAAMKGAIQ